MTATRWGGLELAGKDCAKSVNILEKGCATEKGEGR